MIKLTLTTQRPAGIYLIIVWMIINIAVFALLIPGDSTDLNNYIEPILLSISIVGLLSMKKAGAAFATAVQSISLSTSMGILLLAYYQNLVTEPVAYLNILRIILNAISVVYLFKLIFANKFR